MIYVSYNTSQGLQIIGLVMFVPQLISFLKFKFESEYLKVLFMLFMCWSLLVIARGFQFNFTSIKETIFDLGYGVFIYLAPLILVFPRTLTFYKKIFNVLILLGLFYLLYSAIFIKDITNSDRTSILSQAIVENFNGELGLCTGFMLLTYMYHNKKRQVFIIGVMMVCLLFEIYRARRGLMFMSITMLLSYFMIYLITTKNKLMIIYFSIFLAIIITLYIGSIYKQSSGGLFGFLMERADEDTRSGVEEMMKADLSNTDWLIGKGMNGEYFCPDIDMNNLTGYRSVIETGYLQIILKGGLVSLVLFLLMLVPAIFLGFARSKNMLCKAASMWLTLELIYMYPSVINAFDMRYLLVWMCIGICYSKKIRNIPEDVMKEFFHSKDKISKELFF
jgi:hypothetical protein